MEEMSPPSSSAGARRFTRTVAKKDPPTASRTVDQSTDATTSSSSSQQQTPPAQILTRQSLPSLSALDAGDVIECYALFRRAKLTPTGGSASAGPGMSTRGGDGGRKDEDTIGGGGDGEDANKSQQQQQPHTDPYGDGLLRIQKSALAFRYRPPSWGSLDDAPLAKIPDMYATKRSYELTLEYGPSRTGSMLTKESVPIVVGVDGMADYPGDGYAHFFGGGSNSNNNDGGNDDNGGDNGSTNDGSNGERLYPDERYVTWDNEARIYYRTRIDEEDWVEAYYVAPISGAVLSKVLDFAVEYAERHRRYQPFEVVGVGGDEDGGEDEKEEEGRSSGINDGGGDDRGGETKRQQPRTILRSSSSDDFVWAVFDALASMYVDIRPILAPPRQRVRFFVRSVRDVRKLSGIVAAEDLELPGVPMDGPLPGGGDGAADSGGLEGGGRDDEEDDENVDGSGGAPLSPPHDNPDGYSSGPGRNVASLAADFYSRFYDCANAIRTGDYGKWEKTDSPTMEPTRRPLETSSPTIGGADDEDEDEDEDEGGVGSEGEQQDYDGSPKDKQKAALHDPSDNGPGGGGPPAKKKNKNAHPKPPTGDVNDKDTAPVEQDAGGGVGDGPVEEVGGDGIDAIQVEDGGGDEFQNEDDDGFEFDDPPHRRNARHLKGAGGGKKKGQHHNHHTNTTSAALPTAKASAVAAPEPPSEPGLSAFESQEVIAATKEKVGEDGGESDEDDDGDDDDDRIHSAGEGEGKFEDEDSGFDENEVDEAVEKDEATEEEEDHGAEEQIDEASAAVEAAQKALDAANNAAAISPSDEAAAAAAAQEAANAAKKAAKASSLAKAAAAMDSLFSADGGQMTQVLGTCWSDPKYGIRVDRKVALPPSHEDRDRTMEDSNTDTPEQRYAKVSTTHVYLFLDGTSYYRLNLTPPFWDATPSIQPMPQPKVYREGHAQFLDTVFFVGIIGGFVFGMIVLLHVVGVLRIDSRLKFKKFFHPAHPAPAEGSRNGYLSASQLRRDSGVFTDEDYIDSESFVTDEAEQEWEEEEDRARRRGGGQAHPFHNPNAIPAVFMGGSSPPIQRSRIGQEDMGHNGKEPTWDGDFELPEMNGNGDGPVSRRSSSIRSRRESVNGDELDFDQADAVEDRIGNMKAAMEDIDYKTTPVRGRSFNRGESNRSNGSSRRRRSPVESVPLPAQVRMARDPELVDFPGLKSTTPVAMPVGVSRESSRTDANGQSNAEEEAGNSVLQIV